MPVLDDDEIERLLKVCAGSDFNARRDKALVLFLLDTGVRRGECAGARFTGIHHLLVEIEHRAPEAVVTP